MPADEDHKSDSGDEYEDESDQFSDEGNSSGDEVVTSSEDAESSNEDDREEVSDIGSEEEDGEDDYQPLPKGSNMKKLQRKNESDRNRDVYKSVKAQDGLRKEADVEEKENDKVKPRTKEKSKLGFIDLPKNVVLEVSASFSALHCSLTDKR